MTNDAFEALRPSDVFAPRHIGPRDEDIREMMSFLGYSEMDSLVRDTIPDGILMDQPLDLPEPHGEFALIRELRGIASRNRTLRSLIGLGYYDCITPPRHPAQHPRESRLVHAVHALPGRDLPGTTRSAPQLPNDGRGPDGPAARECIAARRSDRGRPRRSGISLERSLGARSATPSSSAEDCHPQTHRRARRDPGRSPSAWNSTVGDRRSHRISRRWPALSALLLLLSLEPTAVYEDPTSNDVSARQRGRVHSPSRWRQISSRSRC